jgi:hypothetical protein
VIQDRGQQLEVGFLFRLLGVGHLILTNPAPV